LNKKKRQQFNEYLNIVTGMIT